MRLTQNHPCGIITEKYKGLLGCSQERLSLRSDLLTLNECLQDLAEEFSLVHCIWSGTSSQGGIMGNETACVLSIPTVPSCWLHANPPLNLPEFAFVFVTFL